MEFELAAATHLRMAVVREKTEGFMDRLMGIYLCYCRTGLSTDREVRDWKRGAQRERNDRDFLVQIPEYSTKITRPIDWLVCYVNLSNEQRSLIESTFHSTLEMKIFQPHDLQYVNLTDIYCTLIERLAKLGCGCLYLPGGTEEPLNHITFVSNIG